MLAFQKEDCSLQLSLSFWEFPQDDFWLSFTYFGLADQLYSFYLWNPAYGFAFSCLCYELGNLNGLTLILGCTYRWYKRERINCCVSFQHFTCRRVFCWLLYQVWSAIVVEIM